MSDQNKPMTPEQREASAFVEKLTDEQLESLRQLYFGQLAAAADVVAITLGPTTVAVCHMAVGGEMIVNEYGTDRLGSELENLRARLDELPQYRVAKRQ